MAKLTAPKYLDLISMNKSELEKEDLQFRNDDAKLHVQASILETQKSLSSKKRELAEAQRAIPYSLPNEIRLASEVEDLEKGLAYAEKVLSERF